MAYFLGTVLNNTKEGNETFDFTDDEKASVKLSGLPVRIEHLDNMKVGNIECDWLDKRTGEKWVLGKMSRDTFKSRFGYNATKNSKLYRGLSLQHHVYKNPDGRRIKVPVEVSICREGRRPGTLIHRIGETTEREYIHKASSNIQNHMTEPAQTPAQTTTAPPEVTNTAAAPATASAGKVGQSIVPDMNTVMQALVDSEKDKADAENKMKVMEEQLAKVQKDLEDRIKAEKQGEIDERVKMAEALNQTWEETLGEHFTPEHKSAITHLASQFPRETKAMFECAFMASKRFVDMKKTHADTEQAALEKQVVDVISKKRSREQPRLESVHVASTKASASGSIFDSARPPAASSGIVTQNEGLFNALKRFKRMSARSSMDEITKYQQSLQNTRF
jgi:hypothetical protein